MSHRLNRWPQSTNERHSLSQPLRAASSLIEGAGMGLAPFNRVLANIRGWRAIFIAPTEAQKFLSGYVQRSTLPQLRCAQQLPQRGSRERLVPFIQPPRNRNVSGDFHRPYETQKFLHSTIQWGTLSQIGSRAATHSRTISTVVTYISLQLAGMSSGVISRRGSPMYFFLCSTPW